MNLIFGFVIACSMYSRIPMPRIEWTKDRMKYALAFFPFVGLAEGILLYAVGQLSLMLQLSQLTRSIICVIVPVLINGGIHMDGFMDAVDALASYKDREQKLQIMKDPNCGAFAVLFCVLYLLFNLAVMNEIAVSDLAVCGGIFVISRSLSGMAVLLFPKARKEGLAITFSNQAGKKGSVSALLVWFVLGILWLLIMGGPVLTSAVLLLLTVWTAGFYHLCITRFGGINGDLAGFYLQITELAILTLFALLLK